MEKITACITSFIDIDITARHYYGRIVIPGVSIEELYRKVTEEDLYKSPQDWEDYEEGDETRRFETWEDVVLMAGRKAIEMGIDLNDLYIEGIPGISVIPFKEAIKLNGER